MHIQSRARAVADPAHITAIIALPLLLLAVPLQAQFGGLVKRARAAATGEVSGRSGARAGLEAESVAFNSVVLELTDERLDLVIRGLQAGKAPNVASTQLALANERDKLTTEAGDLANAHSTAIDAHNRARWQVDRCRNDAFQARNDARQKGLQQKALTDIAFRDKIMALTAKVTEAQMKGDSAALQSIITQVRVLSGESKADTVAVDGSCGAALAPHPMDLRIQALQAQVRQIDDRLRAAEQQAAEDEARAAGVAAKGHRENTVPW